MIGRLPLGWLRVLLRLLVPGIRFGVGRVRYVNVNAVTAGDCRR